MSIANTGPHIVRGAVEREEQNKTLDRFHRLILILFLD